MYGSRPSLSPEWISALAIGLAAGVTSTVLTSWAPVSTVGRAIIFIGSSLSGALFTYWAARASGPAIAVGKSGLAGAAQANLSATALLYLAWKADAVLGLTTKHAPPSDFGAFALIILIAGSVVGFGIGLLYSVVPALVAHWRRTPRLGNTERAMHVSALFVAIAAVVHATIVPDWAVWAPLAVLSLTFAITAFVRTTLRNAFLARVRAGKEPRYRIEPDEGRSVLYRLAEEDNLERLYRENATPPEEPKAVAVL